MKLYKKYNIKELKADINRYGYNYSTGDFVLQATLIIVSILLIAFFSRLQTTYIIVLISLGFLLIPFIISAWFKQLYNIQRFTMISDYLSNIIPIFMQKTKIRYTLGELLSICSGQMADVVARAINYLDNTVNDVNLNENALKIIEKEFPNSRIRSVHKLLLSIENNNSNDHQEVCQTMFEDIELWIKRICTFQKDLKDRRTKLLLLCVLTLIMNCMFVYIYVSNDYFAGFTDNDIYQLSTAVFTLIILLIAILILTRLHGDWLVDDLTDSNEERLIKAYQTYKKGYGGIKLSDVLMMLVFVLAAVAVLWFGFNKLYAVFMIFLAFLCLSSSKRRYKKYYHLINKTLTLEFPLWLREISLSLHNYTVLNAIEESINTVSYPFRQEIRLFLAQAKKDPTSIQAYNNFLDDYDLEDAKSAMKVLYAIQNIGKEDVKERVAALIRRNQDMLDKAESIRNKDSIAGIEAIGYLPTLFFSIQMMISMFAMFSYMMSTLGSAVIA